MKLKRQSKNLQKSKKTIIITSAFLIVLVVTIFCFIIPNYKARQKYASLCSEYNSSIDEYNHAVVKFNDILEKLEEYSIDTLPEKLKTKEENLQDFSDYNNAKNSIPNLENELQNILEEISEIQIKYDDICKTSYNSLLADYNTVANAYNELIAKTSVDFIEGVKDKAEVKKSDFKQVGDEYSEDELLQDIADIFNDTNELAGDYLLVSQITNPEEKWVEERLTEVNSITGQQAVTKNNDPNGMLNKEGGYTSCIYFTVKNIDSDSVEGKDIVAKGTDAGGAIEVYPTLETAENRCEYLSQFDGTLLYSGSYVIVGTMIIRTSYKLSNQEQIDLTNEIVIALTEVK